ncbi:MAG: hypothetical protein QGI25_17485 [Arenicellales bacterium]|jgi:hypothetical protein|nr:hypothetical protein [Arenicellales bacterium]
MKDQGVREKAGHEWLDSLGFQIRAVLDPSCSPSALWDEFGRLGIDLTSNARLVLLAMGGTRLWNRIQKRVKTGADPFDTFAIYAANQVSSEYWGCDQIELLYPGSLAVPLQRLGRFAGCSYPSPIGVDLHPVYGPWFAYRAVFLIHAELQLTELESGGSPCESCADKPCVAGCPVGAVSLADGIDLGRCIEHRLLPRSGCADRCRSRLMCPVGKKWQYGESQLAYHGNRSLVSLTRWAQSPASRDQTTV